MLSSHNAQYTPITSKTGEWWDDHVSYSKFSRQGIDIICASFIQQQHLHDLSHSNDNHQQQPHQPLPSQPVPHHLHHKKPPLANVIIVTGWADSFLRYAELTQSLYEAEGGGFNIHMYDHQSQGLSGRWLPESQYIWVMTFFTHISLSSIPVFM